VSKNAVATGAQCAMHHVQRMQDPGLCSKLTVTGAVFVAADLPLLAYAIFSARVYYQKKQGLCGAFEPELTTREVDAAASEGVCPVGESVLNTAESLKEMFHDTTAPTMQIEYPTSPNEDTVETKSRSDSAEDMHNNEKTKPDPAPLVEADTAPESAKKSDEEATIAKRMDSARDMSVVDCSIEDDNAAIMQQVAGLNYAYETSTGASVGDHSEDSLGWVDVADDF